MSFYRFTTIAGYATNGEYKILTPAGHLKIDTAVRRARRANITGEIEVKHCVADRSGRGRGGHDGRWRVDAAGNATLRAAWSEFGKEHGPGKGEG